MPITIDFSSPVIPMASAFLGGFGQARNEQRRWLYEQALRQKQIEDARRAEIAAREDQQAFQAEQAQRAQASQLAIHKASSEDEYRRQFGLKYGMSPEQAQANAGTTPINEYLQRLEIDRAGKLAAAQYGPINALTLAKHGYEMDEIAARAKLKGAGQPQQQQQGVLEPFDQTQYDATSNRMAQLASHVRQMEPGSDDWNDANDAMSRMQAELDDIDLRRKPQQPLVMVDPTTGQEVQLNRDIPNIVGNNIYTFNPKQGGWNVHQNKPNQNVDSVAILDQAGNAAGSVPVGTLITDPVSGARGMFDRVGRWHKVEPPTATTDIPTAINSGQIQQFGNAIVAPKGVAIHPNPPERESPAQKKSVEAEKNQREFVESRTSKLMDGDANNAPMDAKSAAKRATEMWNATQEAHMQIAGGDEFRVVSFYNSEIKNKDGSPAFTPETTEAGRAKQNAEVHASSLRWAKRDPQSFAYFIRSRFPGGPQTVPVNLKEAMEAARAAMQ